MTLPPVTSRPPLNTWIEHHGQKLWFAHSSTIHALVCTNCVFANQNQCVYVDCHGGAYITEQRYLEMKLLGEIA